jgi:hypothetical protein
MWHALALILLACGYRLAAVWQPALMNFSPLMALTFCGAVYFRSPRMWLVPLAAMAMSDVYLNWHYATLAGYPWDAGAQAVRLGCFVAAIGLGRLVARRKTWLNLFSGALGGSLLFYFATNTAAWFTDPFYARTIAGWWQAITIGHPEYAPTLLFFRNTFASDLLFTGLFALMMEYAARRAGQHSLLGVARAEDSIVKS